MKWTGAETKIRDAEGAASFETAPLTVTSQINNDKSCQHTDDGGGGRQLGAPHEDGLRQQFAEYHIQHSAGGKAQGHR